MDKETANAGQALGQEDPASTRTWLAHRRAAQQHVALLDIAAGGGECHTVARRPVGQHLPLDLAPEGVAGKDVQLGRG